MDQFYKYNKNRSITRLLPCVVFFAFYFSQFSYANNSIFNAPEYKTKEEISLGINNQLEYLTAFNTKNENEDVSNKNWYVFVVGNDSFDKTLTDPQYLHDYLDFSELKGVPTSIKDITGINNFLLAYNERLKAAGKPVIYYGIANKKVAINVPYFTNSNSSTTSETSMGDVFSFYNTIEREELANGTHLEVGFDSYFEEERTSRISKIMSGVKGKAIVVLKYYYALSMSTTKGKASVKWYSIKDYELSDNIKSTFKVTKQEIAAQYKALKRSQPNRDYRLIEAWYNHITGREISNTDIVESNACTNLEGVAFSNKKNELIAAIGTKESSTITKVTLASCPDVVAALDYKDQIKGIRELLSITLVENDEEKAILKFIHGIKLKDFEAFFRDLNDNDHLLLNELIADIDNISANPNDDKNFTSLIEEFLRIGNENNGEYLKQERSNLLTALLKSNNEINTEAKIKAINEVLTFNLDPSEDTFDAFLARNNYENLVRILYINALDVARPFGKEFLVSVGEVLGTFFAARNNQDTYISLLELAFNSDKNKSTTETMNRQMGMNTLAKMFEYLPESEKPSMIFKYLTNESNKKLHDILLTLHSEGNKVFFTNYDASIKSYYTGIIKMFNQYDDITPRIELAKWAIDNDGILIDIESLFVNIFNNIPKSNDRKKVFEFLSADAYEYLNKITIKGVLDGDEKQIDFIKYYIGLVNEFGTVEDRSNLLKQAIDKGFDWDFFWWHGKEDMISTLFTNLDYTDAVFLKGKLAENDYKMFKDIWGILENESYFGGIDADNERFMTFATSLSSLFEKTKDDLSINLEKYTPYLNENQNYLYNDAVSIGQITDTYVPLAYSNILNDAGGINDYALVSEIDNEVAGNKIVSVKLAVDGKNIIDNYFEPFEMIVVEFINDMIVDGQIKFSKGHIVAVPAFYIPWLDGVVDADQKTKPVWLAIDGAVIIASMAVLVSGASIPILAVADIEIILATADMVINIQGETLRVEYGSELVDGIEMANLIWGLVNLPVMIRDLPKGLMKIKTSSGKVYRSGVDALSSIKGKISEIRIDPKGLIKKISTITENFSYYSKNEVLEVLNDYGNLEELMARKIGSFASNPPKDFIQKYRLVKNILFHLYLNKFPHISGLMLDYTQFNHSFSDKILDVKFNDETLFKMDPSGEFLDLNMAEGVLVESHVKGVELVPDIFSVNIFGGKNHSTLFKDIPVKIVIENGVPKFKSILITGETYFGSLLNYFRSKNPNNLGTLYKEADKVVDAHIVNNDEFYAVVLAGNNGVSTKIVGFSEEISSIEVIRDQYPDIRILHDESADLRLVKYKSNGNAVPIRVAPRKIDGNKVEQYEFLMEEDIISDVNFQLESSRRLTGDRSEILASGEEPFKGNNEPTIPSPTNEAEPLTVDNGSALDNLVEKIPKPKDGTIPSPEMTNDGRRPEDDTPLVNVEYSRSEAKTLYPDDPNPDQIETIIPKINDDIPISSTEEIGPSSLFDEGPPSSTTNEMLPPPLSSSLSDTNSSSIAPASQETVFPPSSDLNYKETTPAPSGTAVEAYNNLENGLSQSNNLSGAPTTPAPYDSQTVLPPGAPTTPASYDSQTVMPPGAPTTPASYDSQTVMPTGAPTTPASYDSQTVMPTGAPTTSATEAVGLSEPHDINTVLETVVPEPIITYSDASELNPVNSSGSRNQTMLPEVNSSFKGDSYSEFPASVEPNSSTIDSAPETDASPVADRGETVINTKPQAPTVEVPPLYGNNNPTLPSGVNPQSPTMRPGKTIPAKVIAYPRAKGSTMPSPRDMEVPDADVLKNRNNVTPTNSPPASNPKTNKVVLPVPDEVHPNTIPKTESSVPAPVKKDIETPENISEENPNPKENPKPAPN